MAELLRLPEDSLVLMKAEMLSLENMAYHDGRIHAEIRSAWGVTELQDTVAEHPRLLHALGIGKNFRAPPHSLPPYEENGFFYCGESNRVMYHTAYALLVRHKMFYGLPRFRDEARSVR
jgi:hypothetical protein